MARYEPRADVAAELLDHFFEGLEAGETTAELIAQFGDPEQAAELVRRSKIRSRPPAWHVCRWTFWLLTIACIFYAAVAVHYYAGRPSRAVNFIASLDSDQVGQSSEPARAWPIYESALASLGADASNPLVNFGEYDGHWAQTARWIDDHQQAGESAIRGSSLPALGLGVRKTQSGAFASDAAENLTDLSVPHLQGLRILGNLLAFDARRARERGDGRRVEADISALDCMAQQVVREVSLTMGQVFSLDLLARSYDELDRTLVETPQVLDDAALHRIAHRISVPQTGSDLISFRGERLFFDDFLQRTYADDGRGAAAQDGTDR